MSSDSILERIQKDAQRALVKNAFFRLESALMVGGTILATVFLPGLIPFIPWFIWPILGVIGEAAVVSSSLTDKAEQQKVIESLFREKYSTAASAIGPAGEAERGRAVPPAHPAGGGSAAQRRVARPAEGDHGAGL